MRPPFLPGHRAGSLGAGALAGNGPVGVEGGAPPRLLHVLLRIHTASPLKLRRLHGAGLWRTVPRSIGRVKDFFVRFLILRHILVILSFRGSAESFRMVAECFSRFTERFRPATEALRKRVTWRKAGW